MLQRAPVRQLHAAARDLGVRNLRVFGSAIRDTERARDLDLLVDLEPGRTLLESDAIFAERPADARATTVASRQGTPLDDPAALRRKADALSSSGESLGRPPSWGGFCLDPDLIEFWHGSPDRLHRRLLYVKQEGRWTHQRLQP